MHIYIHIFKEMWDLSDADWKHKRIEIFQLWVNLPKNSKVCFIHIYVCIYIYIYKYMYAYIWIYKYTFIYKKRIELFQLWVNLPKNSKVCFILILICKYFRFYYHYLLQNIHIYIYICVYISIMGKFTKEFQGLFYPSTPWV
jgi:hypothetical protein